MCLSISSAAVIPLSHNTTLSLSLSLSLTHSHTTRYRAELAAAAEETASLTAALTNDLAALTRRKRARELRSAQHRKAGAALTLLEQTDHIDLARFAQPLPGLRFVGRASNVGGGRGGGTYFKGTSMVA